MKNLILGLAFLLCLSFECAADPVLYFSDLTDGVNSGGHWGGSQEGRGAAVSVWGRDFGTSRETSTVTVCGVTLDKNEDFAEWGATSQPTVPLGMQRITFYLNSSMQTGPGTIRITTQDGDSNEIPFFCRDTGTIYFLDQGSGNDSNNGLHPNQQAGNNGPKKTTGWARGHLQAGDVVYLREGVYNEHDVGSRFHFGGLFSFGLTDGAPNHHNGDDNNSIGVSAYPGEDVRLEATETCGTGACANRCIRTFYAGTQLNHWTFSKLTMIGTESAVELGGVGHVDGGTKSIRLVNIDGTTIYHPEIYNGCIFSLYGSEKNMEGVKILGCYLHDQLANERGQIWEDVGDEERAYQVYIGGYGKIIDMELGWNDMGWGSMGRGVQIYGHLPGDTAENLIIHDNWFHHNRRQAFVLGGGDGGEEYEFVKSAYFYNNILSHTGWPVEEKWATFVIGGLSWGRHGGDFYVYNNLIDGSGLEFPPMHLTGYINSLALKNNIILAKPNAWNYYSYHPDEAPDTITAGNNLYYGAGAGGAPAWDSNSSDDIDPLLVGQSPTLWQDYYLQEASPAIDSGSADPSNLVIRDYLGKNRPMDGDDSGAAAYDIGPFEYNGAYPRPTDDSPGEGSGDPETGTGGGGCFVDSVLKIGQQSNRM